MSTQSMRIPVSGELEVITPRSLYGLNAELDLIVASMESDGFDEESIKEAVDSWLDANRGEIETKADRYCFVIQEKSSRAEFLKTEALALHKMAKVEENVAVTLKDRFKAALDRWGIKSLQTPHFRPNVRGNGGLKPIIISPEIEADPRILPPHLWTITPNHEAIRKQLEAGVTVEGCYLEERATHLRLR